MTVSKPKVSPQKRSSRATGDCQGCNGCHLAAPANQVSMPAIKVIPGISPKHEHGVEYDQADLLVLTMVSGSGLGPGPAKFDAHHGGAISQALAKAQFKGQAGEHLTIELTPQEDSPAAPTRHIAVVGLGDAEAICKKRICAFFNYAIDLAVSYQAESMVIPIFPYRSSSGQLSLRGTGAILYCLMAERTRLGTTGALKELRLLCAPQAKSHLQIGLAVERSLCAHCHIPQLG